MEHTTVYQVVTKLRGTLCDQILQCCMYIRMRSKSIPSNAGEQVAWGQQNCIRNRKCHIYTHVRTILRMGCLCTIYFDRFHLDFDNRHIEIDMIVMSFYFVLFLFCFIDVP